MKKITALALFVGLFSFNANASMNEIDFKPYVGIDLGYAYADVKDIDGEKLFKKNFATGNFNLGAKLHKNFGVEAFAQRGSNSEKKFVNGKTEANYNAFGMDIIGYHPVKSDLNLIGSFGLAYYDYKAKVSVYIPREKETGHEKGIGYRFGFGLEQDINDKFAWRGMGRYVWTEGVDDAVKGMFELTIGLKYKF